MWCAGKLTTWLQVFLDREFLDKIASAFSDIFILDK